MRLLAVFEMLMSESQARELSVQDLLDALAKKGHAVLIVVFTIPFLQPIPTVGISTPFGLSIAAMGICLVFGLDPWIPRRFRSLKLNSKVAIKSIEVARLIFAKIEFALRPRWLILLESRLSLALIGSLISINGILMALPLPIPGTNSAPAWSLLALALGLAESDGLIVALGFLLSILCFSYFGFLVWLPLRAVS